MTIKYPLPFKYCDRQTLDNAFKVIKLLGYGMTNDSNEIFVQSIFLSLIFIYLQGFF